MSEAPIVVSATPHDAPVEIAADDAFAFRVGALHCLSLSDGHIPTPTWLLAPEVPRQELHAFLAACGEDPTHCDVPLSCLLVRSTDPARTILVDAGMGEARVASGDAPPTSGRLLASLAAARIATEQIDTVLISHIHPDHVGGMFHASGEAVFPNAVYLVSEDERDFWSQAEPDLSGTMMPPPKRLDVTAVAHRFLHLAGDDLRTFRAGDDPLEGIGSMHLPGHTPGQVGFVFRSEAETLVYTADAMGDPFISLQRPEWRFSFDADTSRAVETRRMLIAELLKTGDWNFTPHFPRPAVGRLYRDRGAPRWRPGV